jgi:hypothetical protein
MILTERNYEKRLLKSLRNRLVIIYGWGLALCRDTHGTSISLKNPFFGRRNYPKTQEEVLWAILLLL